MFSSGQLISGWVLVDVWGTQSCETRQRSPTSLDVLLLLGGFCGVLRDP